MALFSKLTKTGEILRILKLIAWIAFFGFIVGAGAYLIAYFVSWVEPESAKNLPKGFGLSELYQYNFGYYSLMIFIIITLGIIKAVVWYMVAKIISKIELENPFTKEITRKLEFISYTLFSIFVLSMIGHIFINRMSYRITDMQENLKAGEFLFMAGLVFIISQIFKRGVELQSENELTV